jgi:hypothetical protein
MLLQNYFSLFLIIYFICHIPAFIMLIVGFLRQKSRPENAKKWFILAAIYFVIGAGVCGSFFM